MAESAQDIGSLITKVNKALGAGTLIRGTDLRDLVMARVTSGSLALDMMLGGGWPLNCWTEIVGEPSNGKSLMALKTVAANQAVTPGYEVLWVAAEDFVPEWAQICGVDMSHVTICQTHLMEEAYEVIIEALDNRTVDCVVVDSLSALVPADEAEKAMDEWMVGLGARLTNKFMRKSGKAQRRNLVEEDRNCLGIIISQWREKIGVLWGDNKTTPYGRGKEFHYMVRVEVKRDEWISLKDRKVGMAIKARTIKNKTAPPQRVAVVDFYMESIPGFPAGRYDTTKEATAIAVAEGIIEQKGAWYYYGEDKWNGKDAILQALREEPALRVKIVNEVRAKLGMPPEPVLAAVPKVVSKRTKK